MLKTLLLSLLVFPYPAQEASLVPLEPQVRYVVTGKVLDDTDGSAITGADILVTDLDDKVVANSTSDTLGVFSVDRIPSGDVLVLVKMMGYDSFVSDKITFGPGSPEKFDLGVIRLPRSAEGLREVTVVGEKNRIVYKLDRQLISASSSVTSAGGTAVDILSGLPSVLVDSEGNLSFRGSTRFLVYVDGKPSPLEGTSALLQIPAASVEDIEILTTPSARYRTDGDAGIINITTKPRKLTPSNGAVCSPRPEARWVPGVLMVRLITVRARITGMWVVHSSRSRAGVTSLKRSGPRWRASLLHLFLMVRDGAGTGLI